MSVIINEFEVVALPPPYTPGETSERPRPAEAVPPPPRPEDLEYIMRRFVQRRLRVWAD